MAGSKKKRRLLPIALAAALLCAFLVFGFVIPGGSITDDPAQYKNLILMIGDGMGENTLKAALEADSEPLAMEAMPVRGQSRTNSWPGFKCTDSAAAGTALACGIRVINGAVGIYPLDPLGWTGTPASLSEMALEKGKAAGIVTTDLTSGATPAAFSAHAANRGMESNISGDQLSSGLNLIWGAASASVTADKAAANGFIYVSDRAGWSALDGGGRSFAQFSEADLSKTANTDLTPTLDEMTVKAIDILDDNPDGFFLMVEAAHIDKYSHSNDFEGAIHHVREFDKAVKAALAYAEANPDTLVVVTSDHETGAIALKDGKYVYTSGSHSKADVPVFVNKSDAGFESGGVWLNREIGAQLGRVLGFGAEAFPTPLFSKR